MIKNAPLKMISFLTVPLLAFCFTTTVNAQSTIKNSKSIQPMDKNIQVGPRPFFLVNALPTGALKTKLEACFDKKIEKTDFSIGHRGASMQFPEHTRESYMAAARMGAGIIECDVTFTADKELVCRHSQCDLQSTTNILETDLAKKCTQGFSPATDTQDASAVCCTSDISLAEFKTLKGKMDGFDPKAKTVEEYLKGTPAWRTDLYVQTGDLMTHKESIELFKQLGVKMTPELKNPSVEMPFKGMTQKDLATKMLKDYADAGVAPSSVFPQSFDLKDIQFWIKSNPKFGEQAVYLIEDDKVPTLKELQQLSKDGVKYLAPPLWALVTVDKNNKMAKSQLAIDSKIAGLKLIAWSLERSGPLANGGGWYYKSINNIVNNDSDILKLLDFLAVEVEVEAVFSDWPATVTFYGNCMDL